MISAEKLHELYASMLKLRMLSARAGSASRNKRFRQRFQEACEVGCTIDLNSDDLLIHFPHQHLQHLRDLNGKTSAVDERKTERNNELMVILARCHADRVAIATGAALAFGAHQKRNVVLAFVVTQELQRAKSQLVFAQDCRLPIIYVQQHADSTPAFGPKRNIHRNQIPIVPVDQNDVIAMYRVAFESIDKARRGAGPTLIQCTRHQLGSERSSDPHFNDPVIYMEHYLKRKGLWSATLRKEIEDSFHAELTETSGKRRSVSPVTLIPDHHQPS